MEILDTVHAEKTKKEKIALEERVKKHRMVRILSLFLVGVHLALVTVYYLPVWACVPVWSSRCY